MPGPYVELSDKAFRSARMAVITALLAPILLPPSLFAIRLAFGNTPPDLLIATMVAGWCVLWGVLFVLFLGGLRDQERRNNRVPAVIYATGLWIGSSLAGAFLTAVTAGMLEIDIV
jgi:hypothetical protein